MTSKTPAAALDADLAEAGLRPVRGTAREVEALLDRWLRQGDPPPLVVRTSGTTGTPKDVVLSATAVTAAATAGQRRLGGAGRWVLALSPRVVGGLQVVARSVLGGTSPVLLDEHADLPAAIATLGGGRGYLAAVPTQLHRWLRDAAAADALASLDAVLLGGAAAGPALLDDAARAGVRVVSSYGMSETAGGCVYDGVALDGVGVALDAAGRIRIGGPTVFDGYAGDPAGTRAVLRDGWLLTPDLGELDDDGRLHVIGRADDVVVSGGVNVPLAAVEAVVAGLPGVDAACVVGVPDAEWGAAVVAVVSVLPGRAAPTLAAARAAVAARHPRAWAPRRLDVVASLPLLASGKVDRQAVAASASATR